MSTNQRTLIESPVKLSVPDRQNPIFAPPSDRFDEEEPDSESDTDEVVWSEDEPETKIKNEFVSFEQVEKRPQLETLKQVLLYCVKTSIDLAKKMIWPEMTSTQEDQLRLMYETMLTTVPLVRQLDRTMRI